MLLEAGADPNAADACGEALLHKVLIHNICSGPGSLATKGAVAAGFGELLQLLLHCGVDVNARLHAGGLTPLMLACSRPHTHGEGMEACSVLLLLKAGEVC